MGATEMLIGTLIVPPLYSLMITSDLVAAWVGAVTIVSAGIATILKNWKSMIREQKAQDCEDRVGTWKEIARQTDELRAIERQRHIDAEKTFSAICKDLRNEIEELRKALETRDGNGDVPPRRDTYEK